MRAGAAPEPDLELGRRREQHGDGQVDGRRIRPRESAGKARVHDMKVDGTARAVIGRSADPEPSKDQPVG